MPDPTPIVTGDWYTTPARVASDVNVGDDDEQRALIASCLAAGTDFVSRYCNRIFLPRDETRLYRADPRFEELVLGDTISVSELRVNRGEPNAPHSEWEVVPPSDWMLDSTSVQAGAQGHTWPHWALLPINPDFEWPQGPHRGRSFRQGTAGTYRRREPSRVPNALLVGRWGWEHVPAAVEDASRIVTQQFLTDPTRHDRVTELLPMRVMQLLGPYRLHAEAGLPSWHVVENPT